ncbi:MAG: pseudouridine synthase [Pseudomonadota bacterium]
MAELILLNKPYRVLSQFTDREGRRTLADHVKLPDFYPAGRLDYDSEGLLLLCSDGRLQAHISAPRHALWKRYLIQVQGRPDDEAIATLRSGVTLRDGPTLPARARRCTAPDLWDRRPAVEARFARDASWLEVALREGRNRQLRRMAAAIGHPVLRLVRIAIGDWELGSLAPGQWRRETVHLPTGSGKRDRSGKIRGRRGDGGGRRK